MLPAGYPPLKAGRKGHSGIKKKYLCTAVGATLSLRYLKRPDINLLQLGLEARYRQIADYSQIPSYLSYLIKLSH